VQASVLPVVRHTSSVCSHSWYSLQWELFSEWYHAEVEINIRFGKQLT